MARASVVVSALLTCDANFEAFHDGTKAIIISPNSRERASLTFSIASEVGEVDDLEIQICGGQLISTGNALDAVTSDTIMDLDTAADSEANDFYMGMLFNMTTGGELKDVREIADYTNANDRITLLRALSGTPSAAEIYDIYHMTSMQQFIITAEITLTEDLPQTARLEVEGPGKLIVRARSTGGTDAHIALMSYQLDNVNVSV